jgi:thymidylate synthase (FAD)
MNDPIPTFRSDVDVELVQFTGDDTSLCNAARVSTLGERAQGEGCPTKNAGLINYLMRDKHGSPFEHGSMTFMIKAPIFVFREFQRHRVGWSYNEESGRYRRLDPVFYIPGPERNLVQVGKPGAYTFQPGSYQQHAAVTGDLKRISIEAYNTYLRMLEPPFSIAREVARMALPLNIFSSMYATCNPRSLMHFLALRTHRPDATFVSNPQREIEMVAEKMEDAFKGLYPTTWKAFEENGRVAP